MSISNISPKNFSILPSEPIEVYEEPIKYDILSNILRYLNSIEIIPCYRINRKWKQLASIASRGLDQEISHFYGDKESIDPSTKSRYDYLINFKSPFFSEGVLNIFKSKILDGKFVKLKSEFQRYKTCNITSEILFFALPKEKILQNSDSTAVKFLYKADLLEDKYFLGDEILLPAKVFIKQIGFKGLKEVYESELPGYVETRLPIPKIAVDHIAWQGAMSSEEAEKILLESKVANYLLRLEENAGYFIQMWQTFNNNQLFLNFEKLDDFFSSINNDRQREEQQKIFKCLNSMKKKWLVHEVFSLSYSNIDENGSKKVYHQYFCYNDKQKNFTILQRAKCLENGDGIKVYSKIDILLAPFIRDLVDHFRGCDCLHVPFQNKHKRKRVENDDALEKLSTIQKKNKTSNEI